MRGSRGIVRAALGVILCIAVRGHAQPCASVLYEADLGVYKTLVPPFRYDRFTGTPSWYTALYKNLGDNKLIASTVRWTGRDYQPIGLTVTSDPKLGYVGTWAIAGSYAVFDHGLGQWMYIGGYFSHANGLLCKGLVRWDGQGTFEPVADFNSSSQLFAASVSWMRAFDDGSGPSLFVTGAFTDVNGVPGTQGIARYDGTDWHPLGIGVSNFVLDVEVYDDGAGGGPALYVGGGFTAFPSTGIAKWTPAGWTTLGILTGLDGGPKVYDLEIFDDGVSGLSLYAVGCFGSTDAEPGTKSIARWNAQGWTSVGGGLGPGNSNQCLTSMAVFDDGGGAGEKLYISGGFKQIGGKNIQYIARWDGQKWEALPGGFYFGGNFLGIMPYESQDRLWLTGSNAESGFQGVMHYYQDCTPCPADCDHNAALNINDFVCFQTTFAIGDMAADCDGDGQLSIDDFLCFMTAFAVGC
jgi:hypothetical protein